MVVSHPEWGCRKYSKALKVKGIDLGYFGVNSLLNKLEVGAPGQPGGAQKGSREKREG